MPYNSPKIYMVIGIISCLWNGLSQPLCGLGMAKLLTYLSTPIEYLFLIDPDGKGGIPYLKDGITYWSLFMLLNGVISFISYFAAKKAFGTLGNNVTYKIRNLLYSKILEHNIGFFDSPDHGSSVLTSAMAQDTTMINGVGSESLQP